MRGIVVEIKADKMIVLDNQGNYTKQKHINNYKLGQEINLDLYKESNFVDIFINAFTIRKLSIAFSIFFAVLGLTYYGYTYPYSYVSVDINPSMEISLNIFERVISIRPLNGDGEKVLNKLTGYWNSSISEAVDSIVYKAEEENYIDDNKGNEVFITVTSSREKSSEDIRAKIVKNITNTPREKESNIITEVEKVDISKRIDASERNISTGKLILYERLKDIKPDVKLEEVKDKPVRQIVTEIREEVIKEKIRLNKDKDKDKDRIDLEGRPKVEQDKGNKAVVDDLNQNKKDDPIKEPNEIPRRQAPRELDGQIKEKIRENKREEVKEDLKDQIKENIKENIRENMKENIRENKKDTIKEGVKERMGERIKDRKKESLD